VPARRADSGAAPSAQKGYASHYGRAKHIA
jgi:hypothetical protein